MQPEVLFPYCKSWHLIGTCRQRGRIMVFDLDNVVAVTAAVGALSLRSPRRRRCVAEPACWLTAHRRARGHAAGRPRASPVRSARVPVAIDIPTDRRARRASCRSGRRPDGAMPAPTDPDTVGWYALGLGRRHAGNALLDGHVDWGGRLRVFGLLRQLSPGDAIQITDTDGDALHATACEWTRLYAADGAPLEEIFAQTTTKR